MKTTTARTLASAALLGGLLPIAFLHLLFLGIARIPHTAFEYGRRPWPLPALAVATTLLTILLAAALFSLLRSACPSLRRGLKAWLFPPVLLLAFLIPFVWPFALLAPAARRLGGRSACALALSGGAAHLLAAPFFFLVLLPANPLPFSPFHPAWLLSVLGTALLLAALAKTAPSRRADRAVAIAFALVLLLSLATQPVFLRPAFRAEATDALAAFIDATGTALRPDAPYPDAIPPVSPDADPIAALDLDAIREQGACLSNLTGSLTTFKGFGRTLFRLHPYTSEEIARVADALDAVPNLRAAAEAFSAPGYRSSRPGGATPGDGMFLEPEVENDYYYVRFLSWRAGIAARNGDLPALRADLDRIANCAAIAAREPCLMGPALATGHLKNTFASSAFQIGLPLLPDDVLDDLARTADALSALVASRCGDCIAGETFWMPHIVFNGPWNADGSPNPGSQTTIQDLFTFFPDSWCECLLFATQADLYRYYGPFAADLRAAFALPPDEAPAAFQTALQHAEERAKALPLCAAIAAIAANHPKYFLPALLAPRDTATFLRTAVAIERHRRTRGTLPATLAELVPDFLPAVPLDALTGQPLDYQPGPVDLPEETLLSPSSSSPDAPPPAVLPPVTLPGYLLSLPASRPDRPPSPLFFPIP